MTVPSLSSGVVILRDRLLFFFMCLGAFSGVFFVNIYHLSAIHIFVLLSLGSLQIGVFYRKLRLGLVVFLSMFAIGGILSHAQFEHYNQTIRDIQQVTAHFTRETWVTGVLKEKVSENERGQTYVLRELTIDGNRMGSHVWVLGSFVRTRDLHAGERIGFSGAIQAPSKDIDGFDYRTYLLLQDVYGIVPVAWYTRIGTDDPGLVILSIRAIREQVLSGIRALYPGETAALLEGILIGERAGLSKQTKDAFNRSGLTHIVAVSGSNIAIILIFLAFLLRPFPRGVQFVTIAVAIGTFTLVVGPQAPVMRASVFGLLSYVFLLGDRRLRIVPVLIGIALVFCLLDPLILNYDVSFHLSFLAVFGLIFLAPFFERNLRLVPKLFAIREALALTLAATVFTLPLMIVDFGQVSIIAPLANIFIVPALPLIMLFGTASLVVWAFSSTLGVMIGFVGWGLLHYVLLAVHFFWGLSFAAIPVDVGVYRYVFEVLYFMILMLLLASRDNKNPPVADGG